MLEALVEATKLAAELGSKLINMIAFTNLQQFYEAIGNCDNSVCLHAKIQAIHTHIYITTRQRCCLDNSKMIRQLR